MLWIDLFDPSREDERAVEALLGLAVPTREEMAEIEESARLYEEQRLPRDDGGGDQRSRRGQAVSHSGHLRSHPDPSRLGALRRSGPLPHLRGQMPAPARGAHLQRPHPGLASGEHRRARRRCSGARSRRSQRGLDRPVHRGRDQPSLPHQAQAGRGSPSGAGQAFGPQEHDGGDPARKPALLVSAGARSCARARGSGSPTAVPCGSSRSTATCVR